MCDHRQQVVGVEKTKTAPDDQMRMKIRPKTLWKQFQCGHIYKI